MGQRFDRNRHVESPGWRRVVTAHQDLDALVEPGTHDGAPTDLRLALAQGQTGKRAVDARSQMEQGPAQSATGIQHSRDTKRRQRFDEDIVNARCGRTALRSWIGEGAMDGQRTTTAAIADETRECGPPLKPVVVGACRLSHVPVLSFLEPDRRHEQCQAQAANDRPIRGVPALYRLAGEQVREQQVPPECDDDQIKAPMPIPIAAWTTPPLSPLAASCDTSNVLAPGVSMAAKCRTQIVARMESIVDGLHQRADEGEPARRRRDDEQPEHS